MARWLLWAGLLSLPLMGCVAADYRGAPYVSPDFAGRSAAYWDRSGYRFSPRPGVVCDRWEGICYDRTGPDVGLTREYFGRGAARWLEDRVDDRARFYSPREKVKCDLKDEVCLKKGEPDWRQTRRQFGREEANRVREPGWPEGTIVPKKKVTCDAGDAVCYKKGRPNVDQTRFVFGKKAAKELKRELKGRRNDRDG